MYFKCTNSSMSKQCNLIFKKSFNILVTKDEKLFPCDGGIQ